jgi:hypothetical protein
VIFLASIAIGHAREFKSKGKIRVEIGGWGHRRPHHHSEQKYGSFLGEKVEMRWLFGVAAG